LAWLVGWIDKPGNFYAAKAGSRSFGGCFQSA
jgi:hypothetical protein